MIHLHRPRLAVARFLLLVALSAAALVVGASVPALAQTSGTWALTGSMKGARDSQTATLLQDGEVLVAGGVNGSATLASAELYNPATGRWSATGSMHTARAGHTATLLPNGQVLVAGGFNQTATGSFTYLASAELYNPATGTWTPTGSLNTPRDGHQAVLLPDGQVLVLDGTNTSSAGTFKLTSTEVYNPATGTWTTTGNTFQSGASGFTVTLLGTGKVLIVGGGVGVYPHTSITRAAELYDPATATSASTGSMNVARAGQSATLLPNGQVLVAGGQTITSKGQTTDVASAELYMP